MRAKIILALFALVLPLAALPPDAASLKSGRDSAIAKINATYSAELAKLQKKYMAAGNLAGANEIEKEMAKVAPETTLVGTWRVEIGGNKTVKRHITESDVVDETGEKHPYVIDGDNITVEWGGGFWEKLKFANKSSSVMVGANTGGTKIIYRRD